VDTVRIARDFGTVAELLPDGIEDLRDAPHHVFEAIRTALQILAFDELSPEERPPRRIWLNGEKLAAWFQDVERKRNAKYGSSSAGAIEDPVDNEAARTLIADG
jgi:hypothetical protein